MSFVQSPLAKVVGEVLGRNTSKSLHPLLQAAVVSVHMLNVKCSPFHTAMLAKPNRFVWNTKRFRHRTVHMRAVGAQDALVRQQLRQQHAEGALVHCGEHGVEMPAVPAENDQHRDLLLGKAAVCRLATALAGRT